MIHQIFHVGALIAFLTGMGFAFLGLISPVMFPDGHGPRLPSLRLCLAIGGAALASLAADWLLHSL